MWGIHEKNTYKINKELTYFSLNDFTSKKFICDTVVN